MIMEENEVKKAPAGTVRKNTVRQSGTGSRKKTGAKKSRRKTRKKTAAIISRMDPRYMIAAGGALLLLVVILLLARGCGVSHKSPESVVKELIKAYGDGKSKRAKSCYKNSEGNEEILQKEIDATIAYFKAHKPQKVRIDRCGVLSENENYTYVYIIYDMELENGQTYPCISTYMTGAENRKYYVYSPSDVTEDMSRQAAEDYAKFMTTDIYKNYVTAYETFIKKNPGYEDKIAGRLQ